MKIAIIVYPFLPKWIGGTEIATKYIAEHLAKRGHEVHVITSFDEGLAKESAENGVFIHRLSVDKIRFLGILLFYARIVKTLQKINPDIVHIQSLGITIPALISKKMLKIPYIVWGQGTDVYQPGFYIPFTSKIALKNAAAVIALTSDMKIVMQSIYDRDISVIPNGIDIKEFMGGQIVQERGSPEKTILFVGRLHPVKGIQYLIMAMKLVHDTIPDVRLILVGDGEERKKLEALSIKMGIQQYIQFIGEVPHEKVHFYMRQADLFVLSSFSEGFPVVILEAMAEGLPIVATRVGGMPDIIINGINGYLIEVKDSKSIASMIILLLQDTILWEKISNNNKQLIINYTWDNIIDQLEQVYKNSMKMNSTFNL